METRWKEVEAKGAKWLISNLGCVKSPAHIETYTRLRNGSEQLVSVEFPERELTPQVTRGGYQEVAMIRQGKRVRHFVHRLLGIAFIPGYAPELTINHIDGNKLNNRVENLEWVSLARNSQHEWEIGLVDLRGDKHPGKKLNSKRVVYIRRLLAKGISAHTLAIIAGVSPSLIEMIRSGRRWPTVTSRRTVLR